MALVRFSDTERNLIQQAQQGSLNAFGELVRRHYDGVVGIIWTRQRNLNGADLVYPIRSEC